VYDEALAAVVVAPLDLLERQLLDGCVATVLSSP